MCVINSCTSLCRCVTQRAPVLLVSNSIFLCLQSNRAAFKHFVILIDLILDYDASTLVSF